MNSASFAAALVFCLPGMCNCAHTLTPRENRKKARVRNISKSLKKTQYIMNTLYIDSWHDSLSTPINSITITSACRVNFYYTHTNNKFAYAYFFAKL